MCLCESMDMQSEKKKEAAADSQRELKTEKVGKKETTGLVCRYM